MSLYLLVSLAVLSLLAWLFTWRQWGTVARWWYLAGDKAFLKRSNLDVGLLYLLLIGNTFVLAVLLHRQWVSAGAVPEGQAAGGWLSLTATLVLGGVTMAGWFAVARWLYGTGWSQWGLGSVVEGKVAVTLRASVLGFLLLVPLVLWVHAGLGLFFEYQHDTLDRFLDLRRQNRWDLLLAVFLATAVWTPIAEELAFRVIIQGFVEQFLRHRHNLLRWLLGPLQAGPAGLLGLTAAAQLANREPSGRADRPGFTSALFWAPIVVSSLLFALAHFDQGAAPIPLYLLAVGLGFLYKTTGNVLLCILIHAYLNALTLIQSLWLGTS